MRHARSIAAAALILGGAAAGLAFFQSLEKTRRDFPMIGKTPAALDVVRVAGGRFVVGSREGRADEQPREALLDTFHIGRFEVTAAEYAVFLGRPAPRGTAARRPAAGMTCTEADAYCRWLSRETGLRVRLPTEAEWECAARGGVRGRYPWGWGDPRGRACFDAKGPRKVGSFESNRLGLFDMAGNVAEWCVSEGRGPVARGGSWAERDPGMMMTFRRARFAQDYRDADVGFRIVVESSRAGAETARAGTPGFE